MSLTLGEKLRQAREERGFTLSEVSEQTRISSLYLESIEHDDYSKLPGGIFNKGFVKSYAKFVGVNEQEALADYSALLARADISEESELKLYKPEVLTDDRSGSSMVPTLIKAAIILGLMTGGIWAVLSFLRPAADPIAADVQQRSNTDVDTDSSRSPAPESPPNVPDMATLKVEFKAIKEPVSLSATADGQESTKLVTPGSSVSFEPKESLKLTYSKSLANFVELSINGRVISVPSVPLNPKRSTIEFEITRENLAQIWSTGSISSDVPPAAAPDTAVTENLVTLPADTTPVTPATPAPTAPAATRTPAVNSSANRPAANANTNTRPRPTPSSRPATPATTPAPKAPANGNP